MTVRVRLPSLFSERIGGVSCVELPGHTVEATLRALTDHYAELAPLVWRPPFEINPVMVVFLNDQQVPPAKLSSPVKPGDEIEIVQALEGGSTRGPEAGVGPSTLRDR